VKRVLPVDAAVHRLPKHGTLEQLPVADALVDAGEVLVDDPAGAQVQMPHHGIPHLPLRKTDGFAAGGEGGAGVVKADCG